MKRIVTQSTRCRGWGELGPEAQLSMAAMSAQAATRPIGPDQAACCSARMYFRERN